MPGKEELVYLEHLGKQGTRAWHKARLSTDPLAGRMTLRFRVGLGRRETLDLWANQIESYRIETYTNPRAKIYELAFMVPFALLVSSLVLKFNLEDTLLGTLGETSILLAGGSAAALMAQLLKVPVIRIAQPDAPTPPRTPPPTPPPTLPLTAPLADAGKLAERLPVRLRAMFDRLGPGDRSDPGVYRLHGARRGSIKKTRALAEQLEQMLSDHRAGALLSGQTRSMDWQAAQRHVTLSRGVALAILLTCLVYGSWSFIRQLADLLAVDWPSIMR
jgi:hypothetical protein